MHDIARTLAERPLVAASLERAAGAVARLDSVLARHPLAPAWAYRARLDAIRRQAAVDGQVIDPWHLAALIEGVRFRLGGSAALIDRGAVFAAAHHGFGLYRWFFRAGRGAAGGNRRSGGPPRFGRRWSFAAARRRARRSRLARSGR
jgi:hypothetical protein